MAKYINMDDLLEDIEHSVVFTLRPDKPSSINAELRGANKIIDRIQCAPAADVVEVRHGHFGKHTSPFTAPCSECGTSMNTHWHYCPSCGAKMDGGANDA